MDMISMLKKLKSTRCNMCKQITIALIMHKIKHNIKLNAKEVIMLSHLNGDKIC